MRVTEGLMLDAMQGQGRLGEASTYGDAWYADK